MRTLKYTTCPVVASLSGTGVYAVPAVVFTRSSLLTVTVYSGAGSGVYAQPIANVGMLAQSVSASRSISIVFFIKFPPLFFQSEKRCNL